MGIIAKLDNEQFVLKYQSMEVLQKIFTATVFLKKSSWKGCTLMRLGTLAQYLPT